MATRHDSIRKLLDHNFLAIMTMTAANATATTTTLPNGIVGYTFCECMNENNGLGEACERGEGGDEGTKCSNAVTEISVSSFY